MYLTDDSVQNMLKANPRVREILETNGLPAKATLENIRNIVNGHLTQTQEFASGIAMQLGLSKEERRIIETGALFHDFGKILIPTSVLEKESHLDEDERSIIDLHSELGYELLKTTNLAPEVLDIIRYHHSPEKNKDLAIQIIAAADIYSALREERAYKPSYKHSQAMYIMQEYVNNGRLNKKVVDALESYMLQGSVK
jgi:putative nucleotidyltransferase with HDIG domain